jgi:hypothetical protein
MCVKSVFVKSIFAPLKKGDIVMKKSVVLLVLVVSMIVSACATYTCPTYSKAPQNKTVKESRI